MPWACSGTPHPQHVPRAQVCGRQAVGVPDAWRGVVRGDLSHRGSPAQAPQLSRRWAHAGGASTASHHRPGQAWARIELRLDVHHRTCMHACMQSLTCPRWGQGRLQPSAA